MSLGQLDGNGIQTRFTLTTFSVTRKNFEQVLVFFHYLLSQRKLVETQL